MAYARPTVIALTPVRNEAWILDRYLRAAALWADHIVVADQGSDDGSREIADAHPLVTLVDNPADAYDEAARQRLLIDAARTLPAPGGRLLVALDADEALTANVLGSDEWARVLAAPPGTVIGFDWVNVAPDGWRGWIPPKALPLAFMDDGRPHEGTSIHSARVPVPADAPTLRLTDIKVLHFQYTDWERMKSKQRWYQCWERLRYPDKRPVTLYRQYHHMDSAIATAGPLRTEWTAGYSAAGISFAPTVPQDVYWWDADLLRLFDEHGTAPFRRLDVWTVDWAARRRALGAADGRDVADPRSAFDRAVHAWLARTQAAADRLHVRLVQRLLRLAQVVAPTPTDRLRAGRLIAGYHGRVFAKQGWAAVAAPPPAPRAAAGAPSVTVLVTNSNNRAPLELTLRTALACTAYPRAEFVVADNGSTDGSQDAIRRLGAAHPVRLLADTPREQHLWYDHLFAHADSDYWVGIHEDMLFLAPDWLEDLVGFMERRPDVDLLAGDAFPAVPGYVEPVGGQTVDLQTSLSTWIFCVRTSLRDRIGTSFEYVSEWDDARERTVLYDQGGKLMADMRAAGLGVATMPPPWRRKWHHLANLTWAFRTEMPPAVRLFKHHQLRDVARRLHRLGPPPAAARATAPVFA